MLPPPATPGERPPARPPGVEILNPRDRVPVSLIIDDSTCLVNLAHFGIPQFAEVFPERYRQDWRRLPREIPDSFVRSFGEWAREHGVKGKYSIVPYPACVGWLDRGLPGWARRDLEDSIGLVRTLLAPDWDIHPEMVSHTRVIDVRTGKPFPEADERFMENWLWTEGKSADQIAAYASYALKILHNIGLPCEGVTTPGGFGNGALEELPLAVLQSLRGVYGTEIPHYFRNLSEDGPASVAPRVESASGLAGTDPRCVVSIVGCTGDWFGGWDGLTPGSADRFITADLRSGRMVDVISRGEPAVMVCHWPGIWYNGEETGFRILKTVVGRLREAFDGLIWMKLAEISRYWAARELTSVERDPDGFRFRAPFACPGFTIRLPSPHQTPPALSAPGLRGALREVADARRLQPGTWCRDGAAVKICFDLSKGESRIA